MRLQKALLALFLSFLIIFSFATVLQIEKNNCALISEFGSLSNSVNAHGLVAYMNPSHYTPSVSVVYQVNFENLVKTYPVAGISENLTQREVYDFIVSNPGIQFRGICSGLCIAVGTAEVHLGVLKKAGLISFVRDGKYKRFFASKKFSQTEMKLISILRHESIRKIVEKLSSEKTVSHGKLASYLCVTSQGLTWQMRRFKEERIVEAYNDGIKVNYSLNSEYMQVLPELLCIIKK